MTDSLTEASEQDPGPVERPLDREPANAPSGEAAGEPQADSSTAPEQPESPRPGVEQITQEDIDALLSAASAPESRDTPHAANIASSDMSASPHVAAQGVSDMPPNPPSPPSDRPADTVQPANREEQATPPLMPFALPDLGLPANLSVDPNRVTMLSDVNLRVRVELGRTRMLVEDVLKLGEGSVVELDKPAGDPVDVYVNDRLVARGEVLVLADNFCIRITDVFSNDPHRITA